MNKFNLLPITFISILLFSSFGWSDDEGPFESHHPASKDIDTVISCMRTCASNPTAFLKNSAEHLYVLPEKTSNNMQNDGKYSITLNDNYTQVAYSTHLWQAIVSGAEKLNELNWVVIVDDNGKVVTTKNWNDISSKETKDCHNSQLLDCDNQTSKRISLAVTSKATEIVRSSNMAVNCIHPKYLRLLQVLIDNKYTYNPSTKKWEKPQPTTNRDPEGAKKSDATR